MIFYDAIPAPNPLVVRLFALERGGVLRNFEVRDIDIMSMENRKKPYITEVNPRGELPALRLDNNKVLTEITAICEYLDDTATGGESLFGKTPEERAETRMWLRRMDLEIAQPIIQWYRNDPATIDFYKGNRLPIPDARTSQKVQINQALNMLDEDLEGKEWLCGDRYSAADIHFYGLTSVMAHVADWVLSPTRKNVASYFERMQAREASKVALTPTWAEKLTSTSSDKA